MAGQPIVIRTQANRDLAVKIISNLKIDMDQPLEVIVQIHRKKRTLDQNALYWQWLGIIGRETGNDPDELHEFFKSRYAESRVANVMGKEVEIRSTAKMNTSQMSAYMDQVFSFAAHEGIILPLPEDRRAA